MSALPSEESLVGRQAILPEIGASGQEKLKKARVLVIGAGGLGSPLLMYLAGAGIGTLGIVDFDYVEPSNLHRQILHGIDRLNMMKTESAVQTMRNINPHTRLIRHDFPINNDNVDEFLADYDLVADGSDNFATRDAVHTGCRRAGITLVSGAVQLTNGILTTFKSHLGGDHPCFRCVYPEVPDAAVAPSCAAIGVLGPAVGTVGAMQAVEVIKELLNIEPSLSGTLAMYDAWSCELEKIEMPRNPDCRLCGAAPQPPVTGGKKFTVSAE
jgi:molybdopterin-synthase adenylyltransferase